MEIKKDEKKPTESDGSTNLEETLGIGKGINPMLAGPKSTIDDRSAGLPEGKNAEDLYAFMEERLYRAETPEMIKRREATIYEERKPKRDTGWY